MRYSRDAVSFWITNRRRETMLIGKKRRIRGMTCFCATWPNTNPTSNDLGLNTSPHGVWPAHNRLVVCASFVVFPDSDTKE